jgi:hypothetical protein
MLLLIGFLTVNRAESAMVSDDRSPSEWLEDIQLPSFPPAGDGSQCATITASGATIAAAVPCAAQKAAIAGVAAFASAVSSNKSVGR